MKLDNKKCDRIICIYIYSYVNVMINNIIVDIIIDGKIIVFF